MRYIDPELPDGTIGKELKKVKGETDLLMEVVDAETQLTCETSRFPRFLVFSYDEDAVFPMTEENCRTELWDAAAVLPEPTAKGRIRAFFRSLFGFIRSLIAYNCTILKCGQG